MKVAYARLALLTAGAILALAACGGGSSEPSLSNPASTPTSQAQPAPNKPGPDAPTGVVATAKNGLAYVDFAVTSSKDGSVVTGYTVRSNPPGGTDLNAGSTALGHVVVGLSNGTSYSFTVSAVSATGVSGDSSPSKPVTPAKPTAASWSLVGSLSAPRNLLAAALLKDGRVLVTGGAPAFGAAASASAELYNPVTQTWTAAAPMGVTRAGHTATVLPSGKVLVVGGAPATIYFGNAATGKLTPVSVVAELYDPTTNSWTPVATDVSRAYHTATLLPNGKVLIIGGYNDAESAMRDVYVFDPITSTLAPGAKLTTGRFNHSAMLLPSGKVLVTAGADDDPSVRAERYDPSSNMWETMSGSSLYDADGTSTLLTNGKVLTVMGARRSTSCSLYDPETLVVIGAGCIDIAAANATGSSSAAIVLGNGKLLLVGGSSTSGLTSVRFGVSDAASLFDPTTNTWSSAGAMPQGGRIRPTLVVLHDGSVLAIGGQDAISISPAVSLYVPL